MENPKILKILNKSTILAVVITLLSFLFPIIPCRVAPVVATPVYTLSMCRLPNPFNPVLGVSQKYWMSSTEPLAGLVLQFLVVFVLATIIFMMLKKRSAKVLDLTHKKQ